MYNPQPFGGSASRGYTGASGPRWKSALGPLFRLERARVLRDRRQRIDRKLVTFGIEEIRK